MNSIAISKGVRVRHSRGSPIYGTELVYDESKTSGLSRIMITTAYFSGNELVGNKSVFYVNSLKRITMLQIMYEWTASSQEWIVSKLRKVWVKHRKTLAKFLMNKWALGKLHGRIVDTYE